MGPTEENKTLCIHVQLRNFNTKEGVINIKEERKLMSRLNVAYRVPQDIDLPFYFRKYE